MVSSVKRRFNRRELLRTRNAGGDDNDVSALESLRQTIILGQVACYFLLPVSSCSCVWDAWGLARTAGDEMCDKSVATPGELTTS
jgi:hypothetical protein